MSLLRGDAVQTRHTLSSRLRVPAVAAAAGLMLGSVAISYDVRHKTTTEIAIGAIVLALICVISGNPRRFLLAVIAFDLPLEWGKYTHWNDSLAGVGEVPGFQISLTTIALVGLYALWAFDPNRSSRRRPVVRSALPLIIYVGFNIASLFVASNRALSGYMIEMLVQTLLLYIYVASTVRTRADVRFLVTALLAGMLLEALLILVMAATGFSPNFLGIKNHVDTAAYGSRVGGTFGTPNGAAAYLCLMLPLALGALVSSEVGRLRQLALLGLPVGALALLITESRGGWISFAISIVVFGAWAIRQRMISAGKVAVAGLVAVALVFAYWGPISQRINHGDSSSARLSLAKMAEQMISAKPLLGVGVNNYGVSIPKYVGPQFTGDWIYTVHNKYLLVWAEAGIGAVLAFIWFLLSTLWRGVRCARLCDGSLSPIAVGLAAGVAGQVVHMALDIFQDRSQVEALWLVAALLVVIELILRQDANPAAPDLGRVWAGRVRGAQAASTPPASGAISR